MKFRIILTKEFLLIFVLLCSTSLRFEAQYTGGSGDGFTFVVYMSSSSIYQGLVGDGFSLGLLESTQSIFMGSSSDGYDMSVFSSGQSIYTGAANDGFSLSWLQAENSIFFGEASDGFDLGKYLHYHRWTGLVGTGWLVAGNWTNNMIPTDNIRVRIPAGVPKMPAINAGTFKIGTATGANFTCKALWIESGASLLCRINTFTENHSSILIDGTLRWKNPAANSFINKPGASILIRNGGVLKTDF